MQFKSYLFLLALAFITLACGQTTNEPPKAGEKFADLPPGTRPSDDHFLALGWPDGQISMKARAAGRQEAKTLDAVKGDSPGFELDWTTRGPANIGARINTFAIHPLNEDIMFAGFSRGGLWRTTDGGQNWEPVFDDALYLSIGDITFDPSDPNTIYLGTGDPNISSFFSVGDGVYRSTDGGDSWENIGWGGLNIITQIRVHPTDPDIIFAAAMGVPFERDNARGLYRTQNGGQSWEQVLFVNEQAGVIDLVMDNSDPDHLFAVGWDRIRNNQESIVNGPNAKVYQTFDGGDEWAVVESGLPTDEQGRIGVTQSVSDPQIFYASYTGLDNQLLDIFKSMDGGASWTATLDPNTPNPIAPNALGGFGWYFGKIRVNPTNPDDIYVLGVDLWRSQDGGVNWDLATPPWWQYTVHADKHDLQWDSEGRIVLSTDGGLYRSNVEVTEWEDLENIPCTQFYRTAVNPFSPGTVYGGAQDNGSTGGNNLSEEWPRIFGGDGFQMRFHPENPDLFYAETQRGNIWVTTSNGEFFDFATDGVDPEDRRNWDMQYLLSPHDPEILYTGTFRVYGGAGSDFPQWAPISDDLTDGDILGASFHTISGIDESPLEQGLLYVGTSDGNVWRGDNGGESWMPINFGLPDRYVSSVKASPTEPNVVYVTFSAFKDYDFSPFVFRSNDRGQSWESIAGDLPNLAINDIYIHPEHADSILFVANDGGVYGTKDAGISWERVGENMPLIQVRDLEIDPNTNELVAASFARSILTYPLDSLTSPTVLPTSSRNFGQLTADVQIVPNPSSGPTQLQWDNLVNGPISVQVLDLQGRTLWQQQIERPAESGQILLDPNGQRIPGTYLIRINQGGKGRTLRWVFN